MKRAGIFILVGLCALPAHGDQIQLSTTVLHAMTQIGSVPTKKEIEDIFPGNGNAVLRLTEIANDDNVDFGVRLRAIRALPEFCLPSCTGSSVHQSLVTLVENVRSEQASDTSGKTTLLLRAAIEAIGVSKSSSASDVTLLAGFLDNPSRDLRAATAFALRDLCQQAAVTPLRNRYNIEMGVGGVPQVRLAISAALRDLNTCSN